MKQEGGGITQCQPRNPASPQGGVNSAARKGRSYATGLFQHLLGRRPEGERAKEGRLGNFGQ